MARKVRLEYGGAIYLLMSRGDRREPIFKDDIDRRRFLEPLAETCLNTGWEVHVYCRMSNLYDPVKLRLAARLRRETPMTLKWIAARLRARTWKNPNRRLYEYRESKEK